MSNSSSIPFVLSAARRVLSLSTRLTIACLVYFIEGVFASVVILFPKGQGMIVGGTVLAWASCAALWRFRGSKLGADIFDLYFFDALVASGMAICYAMGGNAELGAYISGGLMFMRFTRIFAWEGTTTHDAGWGVFGPMGYFQDKKLGQGGNKKAMMQSLGLAILGAAIAAILHRQLSEGMRVALVWSCGLGFVIAVGPQLLRMLRSLIASAMASNERVSELATKLAECQQKLVLLQNANKLPDEETAQIVALLSALPPRQKAGLLQFAKKMAENFGTDAPGKND